MRIQDRDHYRNVTSLRRKSQGTSAFRIALFWVLIIGVGVFVTGKYLDSRRSSELPVTTTPSLRETTQAAPTASPVPPTSLPPQTSATLPSSPIYRCGNNYSNTPCTGGRAISGPASSGFDSRPSEKMARLVADGRSAENDVSTTIVTNQRSASPAECPLLAQAIAAIDRDARNPLSMQRQDYLRDQRKRVRDRQFALHC